MSSRIRELETALNAMTAQGRMLDALARYYAEDCVFEEADGSRRIGRQAQHDHLAGFFAGLKGLDAATLHAQGVGDGVGLSQWTFAMTAGDGTPIVWNEVLVRRWEKDQVVSECFYQASANR